MEQVPSSVIILGGGVIGVEFASVWASFGAKVTIVEALPHLVPLEDEANSKMLERAFRKRKIDFKLGARFSGVENTDAGVRVTLEDGSTLEADLLLVAVGRGPVSQGLGTRSRASRWSAASCSRRVLPHQRAQRLRRR
jgi:dihydrolipoamide dehydrogenase